jgi:hypothetical protein
LHTCDYTFSLLQSIGYVVYCQAMEKAILKTLIYADIFDYPLKAWEIHKWLIQKKGSLKQVEFSLKKLLKKSKVEEKNEYFFLKGRKKIVSERIKKEAQSKKHLKKAKIISKFFKLIPWVKLIGISGSLAMENSLKKDDIDLFTVTSSRRLFLTRLFLVITTSLLMVRRKRGEKGRKVSGKLCINTLLENHLLGQGKGNIYLAHEVLQMRLLWDREGVYQKYLEDNLWAFKYLPNWATGTVSTYQVSKINKVKSNGDRALFTILFDYIEKLAKAFQLKYMGSPNGDEKILEGGLYLHPKDYGVEVLARYQRRIRTLT